MNDEERQMLRDQRRQLRREEKRALKQEHGAEHAAVAPAGKVIDPDNALRTPKLLFATHHKCASTVAGDYVRRFCAVNQLTFFGRSKGNISPSPYHDVTFFGNASYPFLADRVSTRAIHIIRNPLSVVLSAYYSHLTTHHVTGLAALAAQRSVIQRFPKNEGLALTLAYCERNDFHVGTPGPLCGLRQWNFDDDRFTTVRMEDFGDRIDLALSRPLGDDAKDYEWPDSEPFTFRSRSGGREPGIVDDQSPYRSGHPDGWRRELPDHIIEFVRAHHRPMLERFYPESLMD